MEKTYYIYLLTRSRNSTFYTGVTNDLLRRVHQHKLEVADGFTKKHQVKKLVYYECTNDINQAIHREKLMKKWKRKFKFDAIERNNPEWRDLYYDLLGIPQPESN